MKKRLLFLTLLNIILGLLTALVPISNALILLVILIILPVVETFLLGSKVRPDLRPSLLVSILIICIVLIVSSYVCILLISFPYSPTSYPTNMGSFLPYPSPLIKPMLIKIAFIELGYSIYYLVASAITGFIHGKLKAQKV